MLNGGAPILGSLISDKAEKDEDIMYLWLSTQKKIVTKLVSRKSEGFQKSVVPGYRESYKQCATLRDQ